MDADQAVAAPYQPPPPFGAPQPALPGPPPPGPPPPEPPQWTLPPDSQVEVLDQPRERRRFLPHSLTGRLVTGVVTLVVVLVFATGIGTYLALRSFLLNRLDQQVATAALQNVGSIERCISFLLANGGTECPQGDAVPPTQHEWLAVLTSSGTVYGNFSSQYISPLTLSSAQRASFAAGDATVQTAHDNGHELRLTARPTSQGMIVVTALSTDEVERTLNRLVVLEIAIGASAIVVAFFATTWGVRFSLRRLHRVTSTAHEVAAELSPEGAGLDRRVEVDDETTEVGRLATSMNTLLSAVETQFAARLENERRMRQFLADASHELRTPLTSIRGFAELARMQRALGNDTPVGDNLERIESEGTRMSRLVDDLLTLARSDQGTLPERELVDVGELLDDVVSGARAAYPDRQIAAHLPDGLTVVGDPDELLRAIRNLVTNALMHTAGNVDVRADRAAPGVAIQVVDQGPGLPPEEAAHVFERFWRADRARTRARGGSGLGLAIVASIVSRHGGTVRFDSTVEQGSRVTVWLPSATG